MRSAKAAVERAISENPKGSAPVIAAAVGVSRQTVIKYRRGWIRPKEVIGVDGVARKVPRMKKLEQPLIKSEIKKHVEEIERLADLLQVNSPPMRRFVESMSRKMKSAFDPHLTSTNLTG